MLASMLNIIIRTSLQNRSFICAGGVFMLLYGAWEWSRLPIDVFPDLNRPRVVVLTEAHGLAPEEVESLISFPIESALIGATGVTDVRSTSGVGLSLIYVEFDWDTDIIDDRQLVLERLDSIEDQLPNDVVPQLAPISSIMGQVMMAGMVSRPNDDTFMFSIGLTSELKKQLQQNASRLPLLIDSSFQTHRINLSTQSSITAGPESGHWILHDPATTSTFRMVQTELELTVHSMTSPLELRTFADWVIRPQLLSIQGVSQVFVMGGDRKQFQVLINPADLTRYDITLDEVKDAVAASNQNTSGGYLDEQSPNELLVRVIGRISSKKELDSIVVKHRAGRPVLLRQVAQITEGAQVKRGNSSANYRNDDGSVVGTPAVILTINKQPGADTRRVTDEVSAQLDRIGSSLPSDIHILPSLYRQKDFIDIAIANVIEGLRDGGVLVVIILFLFLLNFRTTFITLTAIPLSVVITGLIFKFTGNAINTMTLGGIAVAIGELVDDAIVDVENIFRRLKENKQLPDPRPAIRVVYDASLEIRNSVVFGTMIVVLVFLPLFALQGIEGRLFAPLGVAYIVSILSSLLVSMTVTPVLSYWLLGKSSSLRHTDSIVVRILRPIAGGLIRMSIRFPTFILASSMLLIALSGAVFWSFEHDFLPPFDEGTVQVNVALPPGTSLNKSSETARRVEKELMSIESITTLVRRTGRAEKDEHAEGVHSTEMIATIDHDSTLSRDETLAEIRAHLSEVPGIAFSVEQPITHLISHMLSGIKAQVAVKVFGDDLTTLRRLATDVHERIEEIPGVTDLQIEQQVTIPQLRIEVDGERLAQFGLTRDRITGLVETAMNGTVVSEVLEGQRSFDLVVRLDEEFREDLEVMKRLSIPLPEGGTTTLSSVAKIYESRGPNTINREHTSRRIVIQCNVSDRGLVNVVNDIQASLTQVELPEGYSLEYGGQFQSQQTAQRAIIILFTIALIGMLLLLHSMFRSINLALQVMVALPMAFIGSVVALVVTEQTVTVAAMVGFISLCGIASRNGILLINHYLHLVRHEGEELNAQMIVRAGQERLSPVLMTALTSGIGLIPLALAAGEPGKEILYPIATVIIGGLITSTAMEFMLRPALFWTFGMDAARRSIRDSQEQATLPDA